MSYADSLEDSKAKAVKLNDVSEYLENWNTIIEVALSGK
jgi:hypothetical protein